MAYVRTNVDQIVIREGDHDIQSTASLAQVGQRILTALRNVLFCVFKNKRFKIKLEFIFIN